MKRARFTAWPNLRFLDAQTVRWKWVPFGAKLLPKLGQSEALVVSSCWYKVGPISDPLGAYLVCGVRVEHKTLPLSRKREPEKRRGWDGFVKIHCFRSNTLKKWRVLSFCENFRLCESLSFWYVKISGGIVNLNVMHLCCSFYFRVFSFLAKHLQTVPPVFPHWGFFFPSGKHLFNRRLLQPWSGGGGEELCGKKCNVFFFWTHKVMEFLFLRMIFVPFFIGWFLGESAVCWYKGLDFMGLITIFHHHLRDMFFLNISFNHRFQANLS